MTAEDLELLKDNTVDFVSFSYYASLVASGDPEVKELTAGNIFASLKNPYLESSEWGWQIDPLGLAKQTFSASLRPRRPSVMLKEMCCPSAGRRVRVVKAARARKISWPVSSMVAAPKPRLLFQRVIVP